MAHLAGEAIRELIDSGELVAYHRDTPIATEHLTINEDSVNVSLGRHFYLLEADSSKYVDPSRDEATRSVVNNHKWKLADIRDSDIVLPPGRCALANVRERFVFPKRDCKYGQFSPVYDGRSTFGRLFIMSHVTAGWGEFGFEGSFTLEVVNMSPNYVVLREGMMVGQVVFDQRVGGTTAAKYAGAYSTAEHNHMPVRPVTGSTRIMSKLPIA